MSPLTAVTSFIESFTFKNECESKNRFTKNEKTTTPLSASDKVVGSMIRKRSEITKESVPEFELKRTRLQSLETIRMKKYQVVTEKTFGNKPLTPSSRTISSINFSQPQLPKVPTLEKVEKSKHRRSFSILEEEAQMMLKKLNENNKAERKKTIAFQPLELGFKGKEMKIEQEETTLSLEPSFLPVDFQTVKSKLSYLTKIPNMSFFDKNKAEKELSTCIQLFPTQYKDIESILTETQSRLSENRLHRLYDIFCLALPKNTNATFLSLYFNRTAGGVDAFARTAVPKLMKEKNENEMMELLALYTKVDLGLQIDDCDILFRNDWVSSSLCHEYALVTWKKEIDRLCGIIADELNVNGHHLYLDETQIEKELRLTDPNFSALKIKTQGKKISQVLRGNEVQFVGFLQKIIPVIHGMAVPSQLSNLFKMRRHLISIFLAPKLKEGENLKQLSRMYTSELVFLRLINPAILSIPNQDFASVKINIIKMIQNLANEARPEKDMLAEILKPIYDEFISNHRKFLDDHSL